MKKNKIPKHKRRNKRKTYILYDKEVLSKMRPIPIECSLSYEEVMNRLNFCSVQTKVVYKPKIR